MGSSHSNFFIKLKDLLQDIIESPEKNDDLQGSSYEKYS